MSTIRSLCNKYTELLPEEIEIIEQVSTLLQLMANLTDADMFIDCPTPEGDAVVVAEAKPSDAPSSYKKNVVGLLAKAENEPAVARTFRLGIATKHIKAVTQECTQVVQSVEPILNVDRVIGVMIKEEHINDCPNLSHKENKPIDNSFPHIIDENKWIAECIDEALLIVDESGIVSYCNSLARNIYEDLGFVGQLLGNNYENIRLANINTTNIGDCSFEEISAGKRFLSIKHIKVDSPEMDYVVLIKDTTDIKEREKELILKSVAIKEMHHRIKNNLQTVASLLRIQARRNDNEETKKVLSDSMNRILAIATTHELLAQSGVDDVNIREVILNVKNTISRYYASVNSEVIIQIEGDDFNVSSDLATTVALIINELLQNSLEHAFSEGHTGFVKIAVEKGDLYSQIKFIDNGKGFNIEKAKNTGSEHLGLSIVQALVVDKLRGNLTMKSSDSGTEVTFTFINTLMYSDAT